MPRSDLLADDAIEKKYNPSLPVRALLQRRQGRVPIYRARGRPSLPSYQDVRPGYVNHIGAYAAFSSLDANYWFRHDEILRFTQDDTVNEAVLARNTMVGGKM